MILNGILLVCLGILAAPSLLLSRKPEASRLLDQITPYQGWIGVVFCIGGIIGVIRVLVHVNLLSLFPLYWLLWLGTNLVTAALGFLLGYSLIHQYALSKNKETSEKGQELLAKLRPRQGALGIAAIVIGLVFIVVALVSRAPVF